MSKQSISFCVVILLVCAMFLMPLSSYARESRKYSFEEVHGWPESRCDICHISSDPREGDADLTVPDRSRLCESCHKGTVVILEGERLESRIEVMDDHPIKFSLFQFDPEKINQNISKEGSSLSVLRGKQRLPVFGETRETAVVECTTCHDPHGKLRLPYLHRMDNSQGQLCLTCHLSIRPGK